MFATAPAAVPALVAATLALAWALWMYPKLIVGDRQIGVPELRPDSRYNIDSRVIGTNFAIGPRPSSRVAFGWMWVSEIV